MIDHFPIGPLLSGGLSLILSHPALPVLALIGTAMLSARLRPRHSTAVVPGSQASPQELGPGPRHSGSLREIRIRPRLSYRLAQTALAALLLGFVAIWQVPAEGLVWPMVKAVIAAGLFWQAARIWFWELRYDSIGLSTPDWFLRRRARLWRELTAISTDGPLVLQFHFADGLVMRVPNLINGRDALTAAGKIWLPGP